MTKEFVPYEQALELAELNFNEKCFGYYGLESKVHIEISSNLDTNLTRRDFYAAPTFSQAFRWFREEYELVIQYIPSELDNSEGQSILHHQYKISEYDSWRGGRRNTVETKLNEDYEEAELECLIKLIDIVKNLNKS
jgi:hypothetical protein